MADVMAANKLMWRMSGIGGGIEGGGCRPAFGVAMTLFWRLVGGPDQWGQQRQRQYSSAAMAFMKSAQRRNIWQLMAMRKRFIAHGSSEHVSDGGHVYGGVW